MKDFTHGLGIGTFPEDCSRGTVFTSNMIKYLKETSQQYDSIWLQDHLTHYFGEKKDILEALTTITHISALFPTHKTGTVVLCNNFRNPSLTAKIAATLDSLTDGKFILGIGSGWYKAEYEQYGYKYPSNKARIKQLEEAVQIIKGLWTTDYYSFKGKYYTVEDVSCYPKPKNPRLLIGGGGETYTLEVVAKYADLWNLPLVTPEEYRRKLGILESKCDKIGRDIDDIGKTLLSLVVLADTDQKAKELAKLTDYRNYPIIVGSPSTLVSKYSEYIDAGVEGFITAFEPFPDLHATRLFAEEVMPELSLQTS